MSATTEQKKEIIEAIYKSPCCRRALLYGVLFAKGSCEGKRIFINVSSTEYAEFLSGFIHEFFGKEPNIYRPPTGGRGLILDFESSASAKYLSDISDPKKVIIRKCTGCQSAFLRGVFLVSGRATDPNKRFTLDFTLGERSEVFAQILSYFSLSPSISDTKRGKVVYFRRADEISDFYGYLGLNKTVFDLIEIKINKTARMNSQRYMNCFSRNLDKMSEVSNRQLSIINELERHNLLSSLPEELEATARMKMKYPDLPLSALSAQMTPSISKPGLSHRLKKIEEIGARLLNLETKK